MTKLDDKYKEFQRKIEAVEGRQLDEQKLQKQLTDIEQEMNYTLQRVLQNSSRILDESYKSKYVFRLNADYNKLCQNRNETLSKLNESIQTIENKIKQDQAEIDELYHKKSRVFQEMKEKGEL